MKVRICEDLFDISSRLKEIDRGYYILYDRNKKVFEVHNTMQKENSFCFSVGNKLDYYAIQKAQKTSIKRLKTILKNIDIYNDLLEKKKCEEMSYKIITNLKDCLGMY